MNIDKETENQIKELQIFEQNLQSILMQKQALQLELSEIENASAELEKSSGDVFKIAGNIMIKASKDAVSKDLKDKEKIIFMRLKSIDTQEKSLEKNSEELRIKVLSKMKN